jgi:hypothetical protein
VGVDALGEAVGLDEEQLLTVIVECERQVAALQARQVAALSALADARAGTLLEGFAEDEVALALTISPNAARQRVSDAQTLSHQLPDTLSALAAGALDYYRARCIVEAVSGLDDDVAVAVQARVLPGAAERTATQLRAALRRAVLAVDPVGAAARHAMAAADRRVDFHPDANGMAYLGVAAPADDTLAVYTAIDGLARAARRVSGETRTLPQLRADTLADIARDILAAGGWRGLALPRRRHRAHLLVTVGADTLLGVTGEPGWVAGYGPISATMARRIATDATWRRILTDPMTGSLLDYGRAAHDPGAVLEGHVLTRDQTCVNPVCSTPASSCDLDHTIPHPAGPTAARNLGCLCRHTHRAKQAGFELVQPEPGVFRWTTPTGRTYTRRPPALASPRPDHRHRARPPCLTNAVAHRINTLGWRLTHMTRSGPAVNGGGVRPAAARRGERAARRSAG